MEEIKKETKPAEKTEEKKVEKKAEPKANNKKVEVTKKNNNNTIIGIAIAVAVIILVVIMVSIFLGKDSPKKVVEKAFSELKSGTYAQEILSGLLEGEEGVQAEAQKLFFEKLQWKVLSENEEGDKATVEVEITNKDFKTIIGNYMQKALKIAFSGQTVSEEEMTNYLMEELKNEEVQTVTNRQTITLEKRDGKWEITEEETFANAVLPGLSEAISSFN